MPFLTEELYQKLPNYAEKKESISIANYPTHLTDQDILNKFEISEKEMSIIQ